MKNIMLVIFDNEGHVFSTPKNFTPKMFNALKAIAERYNVIFAPNTYAVRRVIKTSKGWKKV